MFLYSAGTPPVRTVVALAVDVPVTKVWPDQFAGLKTPSPRTMAWAEETNPMVPTRTAKAIALTGVNIRFSMLMVFLPNDWSWCRRKNRTI